MRSQPITQGVFGPGAGDSSLNTIRLSNPEKQEEIVTVEEFPSWAGNMNRI